LSTRRNVAPGVVCHHWETRARAARFRELKAEMAESGDGDGEAVDSEDETDDVTEPLVAPGDD
jgi:hypothetical protein